MSWKRWAVGVLVALSLVANLPISLRAEEEPAFTRQADVICGRKYGVALTLDVFTPLPAPATLAEPARPHTNCPLVVPFGQTPIALHC
jgi:hypothetical protein